MNIANLVFVFTPSLSPAYHIMFIGPTITLENATACRVFRQLKFDTRRQYIDSIVGDLHFSTTRPSDSPHAGGLQFRVRTTKHLESQDGHSSELSVVRDRAIVDSAKEDRVM
jgi:hypothetical protein